MKSIPELKNVPFDVLESLYIPKEAIDPDLDEMIQNKDDAIKNEYKQILTLPVYERAINNNLFCEGGVCVQGLGGYPDIPLCELILFSIVFRICQEIEYNGIKYFVSVFTESVLSGAIGEKAMPHIQKLHEFPYCNSCFDIKIDGDKFMFIFRSRLENDAFKR